ncbi:hypothetical protein LTR37_000643 [Vermiconidia calcicola]|uniref:Uncharacterized protein n=1 Tax=Vermiconidia calcicola TaxID=1690605 RepID=A0ACC3NYR7_9PEZI|nr:hypothetical protein LTR37_000643 [Vermiconidia calcicola]
MAEQPAENGPLTPFWRDVDDYVRCWADRNHVPVEQAWTHAKVYSRGLANATRKQGNNTNNQNQPPSRGNNESPTAYSPGAFGAQNMPPAPPSPSLTSTMTANDQAHQTNQAPKGKVPIFFREDYAGFIVKGNFMTLAARPHLVEEGEWLAHQIVEQNRLLTGMLMCVQEKDRSTGIPTCNDKACPSMSAGPTTYTWIDTKGNPINLPAPIYIKHIQTWVAGKVTDRSIFPTDNFTSAPPLPRPSEMQQDPNWWMGKSSGFPQRFLNEIKNMFKQMFRCYAHLYWQHWLTFWHTSAHRELNTCFVHFMNVGRIYDLLTDKDIEPMAPLVDLWVKQGVLPAKKENTPASAGGGNSAAQPSGGDAATQAAGSSSSATGAEKTTA